MCLLGDGGRIGQLLAKLITNAIAVKDEKKGESEVHISVSAEKDSYAQVLTIRVQNQGEVLSAEELSVLREYFSRGVLLLKDRDEINEFALSIVDLFVRQMQGRIAVTSTQTDGTTFEIKLPQLEVVIEG